MLGEVFQGMDAGSDADRLFKELDGMLEREVDSKFFIDPKIYKSLVDVVEIVNTSTPLTSLAVCILERPRYAQSRVERCRSSFSS